MQIESDYPMRFLAVAYVCSPEKGSEAGNAWNWAVHLSRCGHEIALLTSDRDASTTRHAIESLHLNIEMTVVPEPGRQPRTTVGSYLRYLRWQILAKNTARSSGIASKSDYTMHLTWSSIFWGSRFHGKGFPPLIFGPVGGGQVAPRGQQTPMNLRRRLSESARTALIKLCRFNPLAASTMRRSTLVLATNNETVDLATSLGADQVRLVLDSAPPPPFLAPPMRGVELREPNVVLWVGRLLPIKDPVLAIEVTAELVRRGADVRLEIVGDGSEMARAEQAASRLGIKGRVDIRGQLSWGEVMTRMDAARVLLITSLRESASAQMLEALSRGVPIVGIDQFGVGAFLPREAGIAIVPGPRSELIVELANGLDSILRLNDEEWTGVSQHARQWAENADWASKAKGLIETLCEIQGTTRL